MIDDYYLEAGLITLSRVGEHHWNGGHFGAAVIAAYYFSHEQQLGQAAGAALARQLDRMIAGHNDLFLPHDRAGKGMGDVTSIIAALDDNIVELHAIGHNVIFASLALKALRQRPELATPATIAGLVALVRQFYDHGPGRPFYGWPDILAVRVEPADDVPAYTDEATIALSALAAFSAIENVYPFLHQGIVGHLLTHAHALIELARLGYGELAAKGHDAHRLYVKLSRNQPDEGEPIPKHNNVCSVPLEADYWKRDLEGSRQWLVGHVFKYTYSFYDLVRHVDSESDRQRYQAQLAYVLTEK